MEFKVKAPVAKQKGIESEGSREHGETVEI